MKLKLGRPKEINRDTLWTCVHRELAAILGDCEISVKGESICLTYSGSADILKKQTIKLGNLLEQIKELQDERLTE